MTKCKLCGDPTASCGPKIAESIIALDHPTERTSQMEAANYRVKRYINGHLADVAVTTDKLTTSEKAAFGLTKPRSAKNKARKPAKNKAAADPAAQLEAAGAVKGAGGWWTLPVNDEAGEPVKVQGTKAALAHLSRI